MEVTDATAEYNASRYRLSVFYDLAVAITPGWLRSELMLDNFGVTESTWRAAVDPTAARLGEPVARADFARSESPRYVGRAVASLAADPERHRWNQRSRASTSTIPRFS